MRNRRFILEERRFTFVRTGGKGFYVALLEQSCRHWLITQGIN